MKTSHLKMLRVWLLSGYIYLPIFHKGQTLTPKIIYDSDDANVPETTYIRLRYQDADGKNKVLEIYQRYTRDEGLNSNPNPESAKVNLLYWMIPSPESLPESVNAITREMKITASAYETDKITWLLYEIIDPSEYRSTMTTWIRDHVEYRVLSYFPVEEIKKITLSILEYSTPNP